jgi:NADPH:quinone reductase-like Zn-dependent oxidoreductase
MRAWVIGAEGGIGGLRLEERPRPEPGPGEVRIRMRASAVNYRDLSIVSDPVGRGVTLPRIPNSDGAGEVTAVGPGVTEFAPGDRVASCFFADWTDGACTPAAMASALGGARDGVLAEEVVLPARGVVPVPAHLSFAEAATLPCAGLTAWRALTDVGQLLPGQTVLLLGTGGVSVFALQFAAMAGGRAIVTSSSDAKLGRARTLGAWGTVNYRATPVWEAAVMELTEGRGVDLVVETGGPGTLARSVTCTRIAGTIVLIGVLAGGQIDPTPIMRKSIRLQGLYVGPRRAFLDMNRAIAAHGLRPVIDARFPFAAALDAYRALKAAGHFGKIVIEMPD